MCNMFDVKTVLEWNAYIIDNPLLIYLTGV